MRSVAGRPGGALRRESAFTLIELAVALLVIALIVAGILVGRDLIAHAQLRGTISQLNQYNAAVNTFRGKFNCLPGDCPNALDFGLGDASCPNPNPCSLATGMMIGGDTWQYDHAGCNGDGDGRLGDNVLSAFACPENLSFWRHLSGAGLVDAPADGRTIFVSGDAPVFGVSAPFTKARKAGIMVRDYYYVVGLDDAFPGLLRSKYLLPWEAEYIDKKLDDGLSASGRVRAFNVAAGCLSAGQYNIKSPSAACSIRINIPLYSP